MATRYPVVQTKGNINAVVQMTWSGLLQGDVGDAIDYTPYLNKTFQVFGTFGVGCTVTIQGSNDGVNWNTLSNATGSSLTFTSSAIRRTDDVPMFVRPLITGGDGSTNITVICVGVAYFEGGGR